MVFIEANANPAGACMVFIERNADPAGASYNYLQFCIEIIASVRILLICFSRTCVGRLLGELRRSRDAHHKVYRLANVVQTPRKDVKVEHSVFSGLLENMLFPQSLYHTVGETSQAFLGR